MPNDGRLLLALDSSTEIAGLALYDGSSVSELTWNAGRHQTVSLIPEVDRLLRMNGQDLSAVRAVAVAIGPGSFNGLRVGLSVAKGLAYALGLPLVGVGTLDATAYPHTGTRAPIRAVVLAGRGRAVYADFRYRNGIWRRLSDLRNVPVGDLVEGLSEKTVIVGDLSEELAERLGAAPLAVIPPPALRVRRPSYLAEIGFRRWQAQEVDVLEALEPVYVHGVAPGGQAAAG